MTALEAEQTALTSRSMRMQAEMAVFQDEMMALKELIKSRMTGERCELAALRAKVQDLSASITAQDAPQKLHHGEASAATHRPSVPSSKDIMTKIEASPSMLVPDPDGALNSVSTMQASEMRAVTAEMEELGLGLLAEDQNKLDVRRPLCSSASVPSLLPSLMAGASPPPSQMQTRTCLARVAELDAQLKQQKEKATALEARLKQSRSTEAVPPSPLPSWRPTSASQPQQSEASPATHGVQLTSPPQASPRQTGRTLSHAASVPWLPLSPQQKVAVLVPQSVRWPSAPSPLCNEMPPSPFSSRRSFSGLVSGPLSLSCRTPTVVATVISEAIVGS